MSLSLSSYLSLSLSLSLSTKRSTWLFQRLRLYEFISDLVIPMICSADKECSHFSCFVVKECSHFSCFADKECSRSLCVFLYGSYVYSVVAQWTKSVHALLMCFYVVPIFTPWWLNGRRMFTLILCVFMWFLCVLRGGPMDKECSRSLFVYFYVVPMR